MSTTFLFWPLPGAALTSLAICASRIFLKSSCVRSLLLLIATALAFLSSSGILCSFSAWCQNVVKCHVNVHDSIRCITWRDARAAAPHNFPCVFIGRVMDINPLSIFIVITHTGTFPAIWSTIWGILAHVKLHFAVTAMKRGPWSNSCLPSSSPSSLFASSSRTSAPGI